MEILLRVEELYSKENDMKTKKKVIEEMETITDQYDEKVDSGMSLLTIMKPKRSSMEIEATISS